MIVFRKFINAVDNIENIIKKKEHDYHFLITLNYIAYQQRFWIIKKEIKII